MKSNVLTILVTAALVFSAGSAMSQPPPPPPPPQQTSAPVDSGAITLLIATACYGYMQLKKKAIA